MPQIKNWKFDKAPNTCPICHVAIVPKAIEEAILGWDKGSTYRLQIVFLCANNECNQFFVATYHQGRRDTSVYYLSQTAPMTAQEIHWGEKIEELSPTFVKIFNQAMAAEAHNLDEIAGVGFRKALEFLVKDFAIAENPDKAEEVRAKFLGRCIDDYIEDSTVKKTASRAAWLGNDETHYMRKWEDKDIGDLKTLIRITVNFIENILLARQYEEEMPDG